MDVLRMDDYERKTNPKGTGARYGETMKTLSPTHLAILNVLLEHGGLTKSEITRHLNEDAEENNLHYVAGCTVSGRLSELCGNGLTRMRYAKVQLQDYSSMQFRFKKLPTWRLTKKATELFKEKQQPCLTH